MAGPFELAGGFAGSWAGGELGALGGGAVGTLVEPGGGTVVGGIAGGYLGSKAGAAAVGTMGSWIDTKLGLGDQGKCAGHCVANEASDGDIKKLSDKELDKAAKANGYKDAHDLKGDYGLDSTSDIGADKAGNLYAGPRLKGQGGFQPLGINKGGS